MIDVDKVSPQELIFAILFEEFKKGKREEKELQDYVKKYNITRSVVLR